MQLVAKLDGISLFGWLFANPDSIIFLNTFRRLSPFISHSVYV